ncbi:DUF4317 family protein [Butyricicoccus sp. OM06-6AC]|nr:DUF4317 family protein [Butyricicoccus sp. OM06-6AC]
MYYVKTGRPSHPEFIENVLGCVAQRTAAEDKLAFKNVVHDASVRMRSRRTRRSSRCRRPSAPWWPSGRRMRACRRSS